MKINEKLMKTKSMEIDRSMEIHETLMKTKSMEINRNQ
jgi:hypothetical protein